MGNTWLDSHKTSQHSVSHEFINIIGILNIEVHRFHEAFTYLQEDPDLRPVKTLMHIYQDKHVQPLLQTVSDLFTWNPEINLLEIYDVISVLLPDTHIISKEQMKNSNPMKQIVK
jgi:hypothetical protein